MGFAKGNKQGGRRPEDEWLKRIARQYAPDAFNVLIDNLKADDPGIRLKSAEAILNRAYGKPKEQVDLDVSGSWSVKVCIE